MKWAIIGLIGLVVLGGVGYAIYELTDWTERGEEWWDEKKLENFPAHAAREIEEMESRLTKLKDTRKELDLERIKLAGGEKFKDSNFSDADTGFMTKYGYETKIKWYTDAGNALGKAYTDAAAAPGAVIDSGTGKLDSKAEMTVSFVNPKDGRQLNNQVLTAADVLNMLGEIETDLSTLEYELPLVEQAIAEYSATISEVDETIAAQEQALKEFKMEVKKIEAELKMIKVKEDIAEINKAIAGKESNSKLGGMIAQYEKKKKDFTAKQVQAEGESTGKPKSLADLGKGSKGTTSTSRFIK